MANIIAPYTHWLNTLPPEQRRTAKVMPPGVTDMASNDYLGLRTHPALVSAAAEYAQRYGAGAGASRLVSGTLPCHEELENALATFKKTEAALTFTSGFQASSTILPALLAVEMPKPPVVLLDRLSHASLLKGVQASGVRFRRFRHNDMEHLKTLLAETASTHTPYVITESVFSMDGDIAPLSDLLGLKERYGFFLYLDEAHATGILGTGGHGLAADFPGQVDMILGTGGKALGSGGAFVACNTILRDYLLQRCSGIIYSTALPPPVTGSLLAALKLVPAMDRERTRLQQHATLLDSTFPTAIVPVILGDNRTSLAAHQHLLEHGFFCPAIRPPTVPDGTARLRISLNAGHRTTGIQRLAGLLKNMRQQ